MTTKTWIEYKPAREKPWILKTKSSGGILLTKSFATEKEALNKMEFY